MDSYRYAIDAADIPGEFRAVIFELAQPRDCVAAARLNVVVALLWTMSRDRVAAGPVARPVRVLERALADFFDAQSAETWQQDGIIDIEPIPS
jgi:hypothetical protein